MKLNSIIKSTIIAAAVISTSLQAKPAYVATTAIVEHPALDAVRDGIKSVLNESGYEGSQLKFTYELRKRLLVLAEISPWCFLR